MSTVSGFLIGLVVTATLTVLYAEQLGKRVDRVLRPFAQSGQPGAQLAGQPGDQRAKEALQVLPSAEPETKTSEVLVSAPPGSTLEQQWAEFAASGDSLQPSGEFPWRACFKRAAASYGLPESLLLALASGESGFDPAARSDKDAVGLMQIRWPDTSRHLGIRREADLYDPCTNVDAGARYLVELTEQFGNNLHLAVAAYNYGPARIAEGRVPEGARWYSQYIFGHLEQVLGREPIATSELTRPASSITAGHQVLMRFNRPQRARDFIAYLSGQVPELNLQQLSEGLGHYEVVLLYQSEHERVRALDAISESGVVTLYPPSNGKLSL